MAVRRKDAKMITIRVIDVKDKVIRFQMKETTIFKNLLKVYAEKAGISLTTSVFKFGKIVVRKTYTPKDLKMNNNDVVVVYSLFPEVNR